MADPRHNGQGKTPDDHAPPPDQTALRENAATQHRHWVRINRVCNQRCIFCLDADMHDGAQFGRAQVEEDIDRGKATGGRLVISGGEASIHPDFLHFIAYGRAAGFTHIQTITNGRMFSREAFAAAALDAGLTEVTFSIHGHTPAIHDTMTGTPGSFAQAVKGLVNVLKDGRAIVNVDVAITRVNYRHLDDILTFFQKLGVHEFDLLQVVPFGRAWPEHAQALFYDLEEAFPYLNRAFKNAHRPGNVIWTNRFPVAYLEDLEELIQDPHKLHDEVRGRAGLYEGYLRRGEPLSCAGERCRHCFIADLCATLFAVQQNRGQSPVPALAVNLSGAHAAPDYRRPPLTERDLIDRARLLPLKGLTRLHVEADNLASLMDFLNGIVPLLGNDPAPAALGVHSLTALDHREVLACLKHLDGRFRLVRLDTPGLVDNDLLLDTDGFELGLTLSPHTALWAMNHAELLENRATRGGFSLVYEPRSLLSDTKRTSGDWQRFFAAWRRTRPQSAVATRDLPPCLGLEKTPLPPGHDPASWLWLDMLGDDGVLDMHRFVEWYIRHGYRVKSLGCASCRHHASCPGMHLNYLRDRGLKQLNPIL